MRKLYDTGYGIKLLSIFIGLLLTLSVSGQTIMPAVAASRPAVAFCAEYQVVYNGFATKPTSAVASAQNILMEAIVASGAWGELDWFVCLAGETETESRLDWKSLSLSVADGGTGNTYTTLAGLAGNGSGWGDTGFHPNAGANIGLDDCTYGFYANSDIAGADQVELSTTNSGTNYNILWSRYTNGSTYIKTHLDAGTLLSVAVANRYGSFIAVRDAVDNQKYYKDATEIIDDVLASEGEPNGHIILLANADGASSRSTNQLSFAFAGGALTPEQVTSIHNAMATYMTTVGGL